MLKVLFTNWLLFIMLRLQIKMLPFVYECDRLWSRLCYPDMDITHLPRMYRLTPFSFQVVRPIGAYHLGNITGRQASLRMRTIPTDCKYITHTRI